MRAKLSGSRIIDVANVATTSVAPGVNPAASLSKGTWLRTRTEHTIVSIFPDATAGGTAAVVEPHAVARTKTRREARFIREGYGSASRAKNTYFSRYCATATAI